MRLTTFIEKCEGVLLLIYETGGSTMQGIAIRGVLATQSNNPFNIISMIE